MSSPIIEKLDKMSHDELWDFWKRYNRASRKDAEALVGDRRKGYTTIAATFASYACNRAVAMKCREEGNETSASVYDHAMKLALERLPEDLRERGANS